jgi:hypothetical protein
MAAKATRTRFDRLVIKLIGKTLLRLTAAEADVDLIGVTLSDIRLDGVPIRGARLGAAFALVDFCTYYLDVAADQVGALSFAGPRHVILGVDAVRGGIRESNTHLSQCVLAHGDGYARLEDAKRKCWATGEPAELLQLLAGAAGATYTAVRGLGFEWMDLRGEMHNPPKKGWRYPMAPMEVASTVAYLDCLTQALLALWRSLKEAAHPDEEENHGND